MPQTVKEKAPKEVKPKEAEKTEGEKVQPEKTAKEEERKLMREMPPPEGYKSEIVEEKPPAEAAVPVKAAEEEKKEPSKEERKDYFERLETEFQKPEGKENVKDWTPAEKAYFYQMRKDRKLRQQAEEDRDKALFNLTKMKPKEELAAEEDPFAVLKDRDPDDFLTVKEARDLLSKKPAARKEETRETDNDAAFKNQQINYLKLSEKAARAAHEDFDPVMELMDDFVAKDSDSLLKFKERLSRGEDPAEAAYEIIKSHKDFETLFPAAEIKWKAKQSHTSKDGQQAPPALEKTPEETAKEEKAKQAEKALEENAQKPKTTAHVSSQEGKPAEELTLREIADMSDLEFAHLPKNVRQRYLKLYGVGPEDVQA